MFSYSSLVGGGAKGPNTLEFTPIGSKRSGRHGSQYPADQRTPVPHNYNINRDKVPATGPDSPYDSTPGRFDSTFTIDGFENIPAGRPVEKGDVDDSRPSHQNIVSDGSSSIQGLQEELKQLLNENYNLKVEVATLKQYLKQSPSGSQDLALENSELKQEIFNLKNQLEAVKSNRLDSGVAALQEKEREISRLNHSVDDLRAEITQLRNKPSITDEVVEKIELLENENQSLRRELQDTASGRHDASLERVNELIAEVHHLKSRLASLPPNVEEQIQALATENEVLGRKLKVAQTETRQLQDERDSFEDLVTMLKVDLEAKVQEIQRLRHDVDNQNSRKTSVGNLEAELQSSKREADDLAAKLTSTRRELAELKAKSTGSQKTTRNALEDLEGQLQTLQNKLQVANQTLKEKDRDNYELRAEVRSLMDERNSHSDSQSTVRRYQAQIDKLRLKEETMSEEILTLRSQLLDERSNQSAVSEREKNLALEIDELNNKLNYYEEQYGLVEDAKSLAENEVELLEIKLKKAEDELRLSRVEKRDNEDRNLELEKEVEVLTAKLRRSELTEAHKYNELALLELEELHKKREDAEKVRLSDQINDLKDEVNRLERELQYAKNSRSLSAAFEHRDSGSSREANRLRIELEDREQELYEMRTKTSRLMANMKDKDEAIHALEARVRELNRDLKASISSSDTKWNERSALEAEHENMLRSIRFEHEKALRNAQLENERLERSLRDEARYYKTQLDVMAKRGDTSYNESTSAMVALLEIQVDEAKRVNRDLSEKIQRLNVSSENALSDIVETHKSETQALRVETQLLKLETQNCKAEILVLKDEVQRLQRLKENVQSQLDSARADYHTLFEQKEKLRQENSDLRLKNNNTENERDDLKLKLDKSRAQMSLLESNENRPSLQSRTTQSDVKALLSQVLELQARNESLRRLDKESRNNSEALRSEAELLRSEKNRLEIKTQNLTEELAKTSEACKKLAKQVKDMEVEQDKKALNEENKENELNYRFAATQISENETARLNLATQLEHRLLLNKVVYNKAVAFKALEVCEDLKLKNKFAALELKKLNSKYGRKLSESTEPKPKPKFSAVARAVLCTIKLNKLCERTRKRADLLEKLNQEIGKDKAALQKSKQA